MTGDNNDGLVDLNLCQALHLHQPSMHQAGVPHPAIQQPAFIT